VREPYNTSHAYSNSTLEGRHAAGGTGGGAFGDPALDYASWVKKLGADEITTMYSRFAVGQSLATDFERRFGQKLEEDSLNGSHKIIVVASSLDDSTERIISYLNECDVRNG
jgi:hypothetical protein